MITAINPINNKVNFNGTTIINSCGKNLGTVITNASLATKSTYVNKGLHNDCEVLTIFHHYDNMVEKDLLRILKKMGVEFFHTHKKIEFNDGDKKINTLIDKLIKKRHWTIYSETDINIQKKGA